jgi:inorganic pyrophosphatase
VHDDPTELEVLVEVARFGWVKRREDGRIDFASPLPCPFNYGSVPGTRAPDGDREDALLLGPHCPIGTLHRAPVLGRVRFLDAGLADDKWICGRMRAGDRLQLELFFRVYARAKRLLNRWRGLGGPTRYDGLELRS